MSSRISQAYFLHVGEIVWWRGAWGRAKLKQARVTNIEMVSHGEKEGGVKVGSVPWRMKSQVVVDLDNGHWAYGEQIYPLR